VLVVAACHEHVALQSLPSNATPEQRLDLFSHLRVAGESEERSTQCNGNGTCSTTVTHAITLGDGTEVYYADDLLPVVAVDGETAREAHRAAAARKRKNIFGGIGLGSIGGGIGLAYDGFLRRGNLDEGLIGVGLAVIGGFVGIIAGGVYSNVEDRHQRAAFAHYRDELARQLALCVNGMAMVPCETNTPGAPSPVALPDPALKELRKR
jgi:hypothetical protein